MAYGDRAPQRRLGSLISALVFFTVLVLVTGLFATFLWGLFSNTMRGVD